MAVEVETSLLPFVCGSCTTPSQPGGGRRDRTLRSAAVCCASRALSTCNDEPSYFTILEWRGEPLAGKLPAVGREPGEAVAAGQPLPTDDAERRRGSEDDT